MSVAQWVAAAVLPFAAALPSAAQQAEQLKADIRMFSVMAAINAAGYDDGLGAASDSPARKALREDLSALDASVVTRLKTFFEQNRLQDPDLNLSQYISFALMCGEPPFFDLKAEVPTDLPADVRAIRGLSGLLREFYEKAGIESLWRKYLPAYEAEMLRYQDALVRMVFETNGYLRLSPTSREARGFQVYFDLLAAPGSVNTRAYGGDVKVVIHPSAEIRIEELRSAYLLHLLDRLSIRHADAVAKKNVLARFALFAPALEEAYKTNFQLLVTKSLAHAVEARMRYETEERKLARVEARLREGFILTPCFYEKLAEYEKQPKSMRRYYESMIRGIDLKREAARLQDVRFAERRARPAPRPRPVARPAVSEVEKLLARAEGLLQLEELDDARKAFEEALEKAGGRNAQASYGLGRAALDEADPDLALEHFAAAAEAGGGARLTAMSHIYMGRIEDVLGNRELAVEHYNRALAAGDTSPITRKFAEDGLAAPFTGAEQ